MRLRPLLPLSTVLPLLIVAVAACQTEVYPEAPTVPNRTTTATPGPGATLDPGVTAPQPGFAGGQVVATSDGWLEFAPLPSQSNAGKIFFAFFPYDAEARPTAASVPLSGTVLMTDSSGVKETKTLQMLPNDGQPFLYCWPTLVSKRTYTIKATLTVGSKSVAGDFTYQAE